LSRQSFEAEAAAAMPSFRWHLTGSSGAVDSFPPPRRDGAQQGWRSQDQTAPH